MRNQLNMRYFFLVLLSVFLVTSSFAQKVKKEKVRLKAQYVKIMDGEVYFDIKAAAKVNRQNVDVTDIDLTIYNEFNDEKVKLGKATTNKKGEAKFTLKSLAELTPDSTNTYNVIISFKGNDTFKKASKTQFKGILEYTEDPIVSIDIVGNTNSCIFDAQMTSVIGNMIKIIGWYDNETGYSSRLIELVSKLSSK